MRRLPPLNQIRAFEAVARHLSFTKAAEELFVTPGALTRHIQALEDYYGAKLFNRSKRQIALTPSAETLFRPIQQAFNIINEVSNQVKSPNTELRIKVINSFAIRWFLDKLKQFDLTYPEVHMRLTIGSNDTNLLTEEYDAAIIYSETEPTDCLFFELFSEQLYPVCSPSLLPEGKKFELEELPQQRIILSSRDGREWKNWMKTYDVEEMPFDTALRFELDDTAIQAAVAGHGVALANILYIENELKLGSLKLAANITPISLGAHYFIYSNQMAEKKRLMKFKDWLLSAADETKTSLKLDN